QVCSDRVDGPGAGGHGVGARGDHGVVSFSGVGADRPPGMRVSWVAPPAMANSPGSRANRPVGEPAAAGRTGRFFSVARASIEAILVTETTSRSREVAQAASTGSGPYRRTRPRSRYTARILVQGSGSSSTR